jgi:hypothetical protein
VSPPPPLRIPADADEEGTVVDEVKAKLKGNETLEDLIFLLLDECKDDWWTATEIQSHLTDVKGREVPMSSISPTLTKMKDAGTLTRDGFNVALTSRVQKKQTAAK